MRLAKICAKISDMNQADCYVFIVENGITRYTELLQALGM